MATASPAGVTSTLSAMLSMIDSSLGSLDAASSRPPLPAATSGRMGLPTAEEVAATDAADAASGGSAAGGATASTAKLSVWERLSAKASPPAKRDKTADVPSLLGLSELPEAWQPPKKAKPAPKVDDDPPGPLLSPLRMPERSPPPPRLASPSTAVRTPAAPAAAPPPASAAEAAFQDSAVLSITTALLAAQAENKRLAGENAELRGLLASHSRASPGASPVRSPSPKRGGMSRLKRRVAGRSDSGVLSERLLRDPSGSAFDSLHSHILDRAQRCFRRKDDRVAVVREESGAAALARAHAALAAVQAAAVSRITELRASLRKAREDRRVAVSAAHDAGAARDDAGRLRMQLSALRSENARLSAAVTQLRRRLPADDVAAAMVEASALAAGDVSSVAAADSAVARQLAGLTEDNMRLLRKLQAVEAEKSLMESQIAFVSHLRETSPKRMRE